MLLLIYTAKKCDDNKVCNPCCETMESGMQIGLPVGDLISFDVNLIC